METKDDSCQGLSGIPFKEGISYEEMVSEMDPLPATRKIQDDNKNLRSQIDRLKTQLSDEKFFFNIIASSIERIKPMEIHVPKYNQSDLLIKSPLSAIQLLGDLHTGEKIDPLEMEGFNAYDLEIEKSRMRYLADKTVRWVASKRLFCKIDELVLICLGDNVSGDIHGELVATNLMPTPVQTAEAAFILSDYAAAMSQHFNNVRIEFFAADNHSRTTVKPPAKQAGLNSYNYIVGIIMQERLRNLPNIKFNMHIGMEDVVWVQDTPYLCTHGHQIKGWSGFPWYGADRHISREAFARMQRALQQFNDTVDRYLKDLGGMFHKLAFAHYHVPLNYSKFIVNGSVSGTNEYDHKNGRYSEPCQVAWLVHPKTGEYDWTAFKLRHAKIM